MPRSCGPDAGRGGDTIRVDFEFGALRRSVSVNLAELRRVLRRAIEKLQPRFEPDDESDTQEEAYDVGEGFV